MFKKIINELQILKAYKRSIKKLHVNGIRFSVGAIIKFEYFIFCIQFHILGEVVLVRERKICNRFSIQADIRYVYNDFVSLKLINFLFLRGGCQRTGCHLFSSMFW